MFLLVALATLACATAVPVLYDQRQDGEVNVAADVQNVVFVVAIPQKMSVPLDFLDDFLKRKQVNQESRNAQERADNVMDAFVEPSTPYQVEIGGRSGEDGRAVEVVIAGRHRAGPEPANEDSEELKLIGATEQCGPERERDPVTLTCRFRVVDAPAAPVAPVIPDQPHKEEAIPEPAPEAIPS